MSWPQVPIIRVADFNPSGPKGSVLAASEVAFVPMASVSEDGTMRVGEHKAGSALGTGYSYFQSGDILVAKITPCYENNKISVACIDREHGFGSTEFHVVRPHKGELDARYLSYFLRQDAIRGLGQKRMTGSAGQRRVPRQFLEQLQIPLPPLDEQRRIAAILDQADALRRKRRAILEGVETLKKSIFVDMFGDPSANPRGWPVLPLGELSLRFSDGPFGSNLKSEHYVESGIRVVRLQNIGVGEFKDRDTAFISAQHFSTLKKHECLPGDVLIGTLGDPNLRACIQPQSIKVALNKADCVQMRCNPLKATAEYVCSLLNSPSTEALAQSKIQGQTRLRISMGRLRELRVPTPSLEQQQVFSELSLRLDTMKTKQLEFADKLDALFASLQHRAFRGEL